MMWIIVALLLGTGGFLFWKSSQGNGKQKALPKNKKRTLLNIQLNDIISHFGTDYTVEGKLVYNDDGDEWYEYMLVDGDDVVWLSVEEDDRLEAYLFREVTDLKIKGQPGEYITYEGDEYELEERGRASVTRHGRTGKKNAGSTKYFEYEAPGEKYMTVEQWGEGDFEVWIAEGIRRHTIVILPGDEIDGDDYV